MYENKTTGFLFVLPFVIGVLGFKLFPFVMSFALSFTQYDFISPPQYIGLENYQELFQNITDSFDKSVPFTLKPKQLARTEPLTALNRIQVQMGSMNKENGGYTLLNFSQLLDDELQVVLVYGNDVPRVLELCAEVGIAAAPALEALKVAIHV